MKAHATLTELGNASQECSRKLDSMVFCHDCLVGRRGADGKAQHRFHDDINWAKVHEIVGHLSRLQKEAQWGHRLSNLTLGKSRLPSP